MKSIEDRCKTLFESKLIRLAVVMVFSILMLCVLGGATLTKYAVLIEDEATETVVFTSESGPEAILAQEGIVLGEHDAYTFSGFTGNNATLTIHRAAEISITADSQTKTVWLTEGTAADALNAAELTVNDDDLLNVALTEPVCDGMNITINRVTYRTVENRTEIPFDVTEIPTRTLSKGKTSTLSAGVNGERTTVIKQTLIDGAVVEEETLSDEVTKKPVAARVLVGDPNAPVSQLIPTTDIALDANGNPVSYKYKVTGKATAYSALGRPTNLKPGNVAMNLSQFPRGTKLYIKTPDGSFIYGYSVVADTGPAVRNGVCLVDLFFETYRESCLFGAKTVEIYVLS